LLEVFERPVFLRAAGVWVDDGEVLARGWRNGDARRSFGERLRRKEFEGQVRDGFAEFGSSCAVPGIDFVEAFEQRAFCGGDAQEVESGVGDGLGSFCKTDKRKGRARGPDFGVIGSGGFEGGEREDHVADGAGTDQEASHKRHNGRR
jgi:hypothetical protein